MMESFTTQSISSMCAYFKRHLLLNSLFPFLSSTWVPHNVHPEIFIPKSSKGFNIKPYFSFVSTTTRPISLRQFCIQIWLTTTEDFIWFRNLQNVLMWLRQLILNNGVAGAFLRKSYLHKISCNNGETNHALPFWPWMSVIFHPIAQSNLCLVAPAKRSIKSDYPSLVVGIDIQVVHTELPQP